MTRGMRKDPGKYWIGEARAKCAQGVFIKKKSGKKTGSGKK
jgi:hypothetical protein